MSWRGSIVLDSDFRGVVTIARLLRAQGASGRSRSVVRPCPISLLVFWDCWGFLILRRGLWRPSESLRVVLDLMIPFVLEFFVTANVVTLPFLRECAVHGYFRNVSLWGVYFACRFPRLWEDLRIFH